MRQRNALLGLGILTLITLASSVRHHLRGLSEVVRTYATFHTYVRDHPSTVYRYGHRLTEDNATSPQDHDTVPKTIHQIFLREDRNATFHSCEPPMKSCRSFHPAWTHNLWTDDNATHFMRQHYPSLSPQYEHYRQSIQRANILRYAILEHFGGVYLDLDITCLAPLDGLLHLPWLTPGAYPTGINNAFILARPHHPLLRDLLASVAAHDLRWPLPYVENMLSTGCMFFSNQWMAYVRRKGLDRHNVPEDNAVYILGDEHGRIEPHMLRGKVTTPLFEHGGASMWHGWDAAAIVWIGAHYKWSIMLVSATITIVGLTMGRLLRRRRIKSMRTKLTKRDEELKDIA